MSWSIAVLDADQLRGLPEAVSEVKAEYGTPIAGIEYQYEFVHDYDMLPQSEFEKLIGKDILGCNCLLGLYKDFDTKTFGTGRKQFRLFSVTRLAARMANENPEIVKRFDGYGAIVDAIDHRKIEVPEKQIGKARLIASILQAAANPIRGYPVVTFFW